MEAIIEKADKNKAISSVDEKLFNALAKLHEAHYRNINVNAFRDKLMHN